MDDAGARRSKKNECGISRKEEVAASAVRPSNLVLVLVKLRNLEGQITEYMRRWKSPNDLIQGFEVVIALQKSFRDWHMSIQLFDTAVPKVCGAPTSIKSTIYCLCVSNVHMHVSKEQRLRRRR